MATRNEAKIFDLDHASMPAQLVVAGNDIEIKTNKSGSQVQMLLNDVAVILSAALNAGVKLDEIINACGEVDPKDAPITRIILETLAKETCHEIHVHKNRA